MAFSDGLNGPSNDRSRCLVAPHSIKGNAGYLLAFGNCFSKLTAAVHAAFGAGAM